MQDPSVAYDARHGVWLIASLAFSDSAPVASAVVATRSTDGGATWSQGAVARATRGIGGQPVVQPNGRVVVPYASSGLRAIIANDGGATYAAPVKISNVKSHRVSGKPRTGPLPSAEIDGAGRVYVVWQDCRFRTSCRENDIVMSTSDDGTTWSAATRIPIDDTTSMIDHFIPGIAVDPATQGSTAHVALAYYFYPTARCTPTTCQLEVGYVSSIDGGASWNPAQTLTTEPMSLAWLPRTNQGVMVGDYISTSIAGGHAFPVFAVAQAPSNGLDEAMSTIADGLPIG